MRFRATSYYVLLAIICMLKASETNFTELWRLVTDEPNPPQEQWDDDYRVYMSELAR